MPLLIRTPEDTFGRTMVIFGEKLSKNYCTFGQTIAKIDHSGRPKNPKSNKTLGVLWVRIRYAYYGQLGY